MVRKCSLPPQDFFIGDGGLESARPPNRDDWVRRPEVHTQRSRNGVWRLRVWHRIQTLLDRPDEGVGPLSLHRHKPRQAIQPPHLAELLEALVQAEEKVAPCYRDEEVVGHFAAERYLIRDGLEGVDQEWIEGGPDEVVQPVGDSQLSLFDGGFESRARLEKAPHAQQDRRIHRDL